MFAQCPSRGRPAHPGRQAGPNDDPPVQRSPGMRPRVRARPLQLLLPGDLFATELLAGRELQIDSIEVDLPEE